MEKILITGTGRSGTTFLIKLFTFLDFDTGFTTSNYINYIFTNCNSGMESKITENHYILKNPLFISQIPFKENIKQVIIPMRDYKLSASSRSKHGQNAGGLVFAENESDQILYYHKIMAEYIIYMTKNNINTLFLDFDQMVTSPEYLYLKIKHILDEKNIKLDYFKKIFFTVQK